MTTVDRRKVAALYDAGMPRNLIAKELSCSTSRVQQITAEMGHSGYNHNFFRPTARQRSILVGTLLGDGSLTRQGNVAMPMLRLEHSIKQADYLDWKAAELGSLFKSHKPIVRPHRVSGFGETRACYLHSRAHPWLLKWYDIFYPPPERKKLITPELLSYVDDLALAVWFMDDGSSCAASGSVYYQLIMGNMSMTEYKLAQDWLAGLGIQSTMSEGSGNYVKLYMRKTESWRLFERVGKYIPGPMQYKIKAGEWQTKNGRPLSEYEKRYDVYLPPKTMNEA